MEISYDSVALETLTVHYFGMEPFTASPVKIRIFCAPTLPVSIQQADPETYRLLDALVAEHEHSQQKMTDTISFASY